MKNIPLYQNIVQNEEYSSRSRYCPKINKYEIPFENGEMIILGWCEDIKT